jgi:inorganic pyrophosphatase
MSTKKYQGNVLFDLPTKSKDGNLNMLVEIPKGSFNKYEYEVETGQLILDRVLYEMIPYPVEYGLLPQTWDEDEDMLDVMCLVNYPTFPGCRMEVRLIGVMVFIDDGEVDDKLLAVPASDVRFEHIKDIKDLPEHTLDEIGFFFRNYKELQFKYKNKPNSSLEVKEFAGIDRANEILEKAKLRFQDKFSD